MVQFTTALSFTVLNQLNAHVVQFASGHQELVKVHKQHLPSPLTTNAGQVSLPHLLPCHLLIRQTLCDLYQHIRCLKSIAGCEQLSAQMVPKVHLCCEATYVLQHIPLPEGLTRAAPPASSPAQHDLALSNPCYFASWCACRIARLYTFSNIKARMG